MPSSYRVIPTRPHQTTELHQAVHGIPNLITALDACESHLGNQLVVFEMFAIANAILVESVDSDG